MIVASKKLMGVKIDTDNLDLSNTDILNNDNRVIGELRSVAYSPYFKNSRDSNDENGIL